MKTTNKTKLTRKKINKMNKLGKYRKWTQKFKILAVMLAYPNRWFRPEDFMQYSLPEDFYVGYEANSRLAEMTKDEVLQDTFAKEDTATGWKRSRKKMWKIDPVYLDILKYVPVLKKTAQEAKKQVKVKQFKNIYTPIIEEEQ